jgi:carboxylesterase 2
MITGVLLIAGCCLAVAINATTLASAPTVRISDGPIEGLGVGSNVAAYLGIPFAQSPPERFSKPADTKPWNQPLKATKLKPACVQQFSGTGTARNFTISIFGTPIQPESEDCLYINVWAPAGSPPKGGFPVL